MIEIRASQNDLSRYELTHEIEKICNATLEQAYAEEFKDIVKDGKKNHLFADNVSCLIGIKVEELLRKYRVQSVTQLKEIKQNE